MSDLAALRPGLVALAALALAIQALPARAATAEAQVKAAYLLKLGSFVRWPDYAASRFRICIAGRPDIAAALGELAANQAVAGKPIAIVRLEPGDGAQTRGCQVLFLGRGTETGRVLMAASGNASVLTVTDRNGGTRGGAVEFVLRDGKVRFVINRGEAEARRLELSSKLLEVALEVRP